HVTGVQTCALPIFEFLHLLEEYLSLTVYMIAVADNVGFWQQFLELFLSLDQWQIGKRLTVQFQNVEYIILNRHVAVASVVLQLLKTWTSLIIECYNLTVNDCAFLYFLKSFKNLWIGFIERKPVTRIQSV